MLRLDCLTVEMLGQAEDHLLLSVVTAQADVVPADVSARLQAIAGAVNQVSGLLPLDAHDSVARARAA